MYLAINGEEIAIYPAEFKVKVLDLDNSETTQRTVDGTLVRDRVAVKRQIDMSWGAMEWEELSSILQAMSGEFFDFTYPDPMTGTQQTKTMYVGDRQAAVAHYVNGSYIWNGLQLSLTEQ